eukprot:362462-Chlamydomonas_euryale.AAC.1
MARTSTAPWSTAFMARTSTGPWSVAPTADRGYNKKNRAMNEFYLVAEEGCGEKPGIPYQELPGILPYQEFYLVA